MKIRFRADSDAEDFSYAISEYETIWNEQGEKIVAAWEETTGLQFKETVVNAIVFSAGPSHSHPLSLRANLEFEQKQSVLVHELGHRLLYGRVEQPDFSSLENHKTLFLVLFEVLEKLYGRKFANRTVAWDKNLPRDTYRHAWEWERGLSKEERIEQFKSRVPSSNLTGGG